ncbi:MAG: polymer-forming cytoskeletal protein [Elusimicrobia bacterium]|nr:polymer-forming cytoskeletal protein [Elusimicrobiota bacterium]
MKNKKLDAIQTWIGADTIFTGNISTEKSIRVDGKLVGDIEKSESVVIGEAAEIDGNINTKYIVVSGKVNGNITADEGIELLATAKVIGDIYTNILYINEGAIFRGKSTMPEPAEDSEK